MSSPSSRRWRSILLMDDKIDQLHSMFDRFTIINDTCKWFSQICTEILIWQFIKVFMVEVNVDSWRTSGCEWKLPINFLMVYQHVTNKKKSWNVMILQVVYTLYGEVSHSSLSWNNFWLSMKLSIDVARIVNSLKILLRWNLLGFQKKYLKRNCSTL